MVIQSVGVLLKDANYSPIIVGARWTISGLASKLGHLFTVHKTISGEFLKLNSQKSYHSGAKIILRFIEKLFLLLLLGILLHNDETHFSFVFEVLKSSWVI